VVVVAQRLGLGPEEDAVLVADECEKRIHGDEALASSGLRGTALSAPVDKLRAATPVCSPARGLPVVLVDPFLNMACLASHAKFRFHRPTGEI
jgi:hypothetical protein